MNQSLFLVGGKMNNNPVAWINRKGKDGGYDYLQWDKDDEAEINTPLYAHPVSQYKAITNTKIEPTVVSYTNPVKELTMAEIEDFINAYGLDMGDVYEFSLAQLTKMIVEIEHQIRGGK